MAAEQFERRLAAILAADVVGYSRLMGEDEAGTHARLKALRKDFINPKIAECRGRTVKLTGDGALVEFASVVDAVQCAVEVQQSIAVHNADLEPKHRIEFRVGINLGDVIIDGDDIYGDGVNVAARLEGLAPAGGVCISDVVHQMVRGRLDLAFEDLGEQQVKNIGQPVRVWRWINDDSVAKRPLSGAGKIAAPTLPDKPSIAVLPFNNLSRDPDQEYFSDGLTEDLITDLSQLSGLFVTARHAVFPYKKRPATPQEVAKDLGVRYVLEGSVRRAANRVRITAQLIDASTGFHLWAQRYDRDFEDIFALQDEIMHAIVGSTEGSPDHARASWASSAATRRTSRPTICSYRRGKSFSDECMRGLPKHASSWSGQSRSIRSSRQLMRSLPKSVAPNGGTAGVTTRPRSMTRCSWRKEAWRSTTGCRSPTCFLAGSTCGARSTIRPLPRRNVAWPLTQIAPRDMPASATRSTLPAGQAKAFP